MDYGFFDAAITGYDQSGVPVFDRAVDSAFLSAMLAALFTDGVFASPATALMVSPSTGMAVRVAPGACFIRGRFGRCAQEEVLPIEPADAVCGRIDNVVVRLDMDARTMELKVVKGTPGAMPTAPSPANTDTVKELCLARVTVAAGAQSISAARIADKRADPALCGTVAGAIDQIDATSLFAQYDAAFSEWFTGVRDVLSQDAAAHLLSMVEAVTPIRAVNVTVAASAWAADSTYAAYPYRAMAALSGALAGMIPEVVFAPDDAASGRLAPVAQACPDGVYIYASALPSATMVIPTLTCWKGVV